MITKDSFGGQKKKKNIENNNTISPKVLQDDDLNQSDGENSENLNRQWDVFVKAAEDINLNLIPSSPAVTQENEGKDGGKI